MQGDHRAEDDGEARSETPDHRDLDRTVSLRSRDARDHAAFHEVDRVDRLVSFVDDRGSLQLHDPQERPQLLEVRRRQRREKMVLHDSGLGRRISCAIPHLEHSCTPPFRRTWRLYGSVQSEVAARRTRLFFLVRLGTNALHCSVTQWRTAVSRGLDQVNTLTFDLASKAQATIRPVGDNSANGRSRRLSTMRTVVLHEWSCRSRLRCVAALQKTIRIRHDIFAD